jgi:arabinose-5-phosphate isomerase
MNIQQRIAAVIDTEAKALANIPITPQFETAVLALRDCEGKVLTTGIGKAGLIARKFASTLCSTGTPASFIHPAEAAHGDLGLVDHRDTIVAFSTSGKSSEVLEMLELSRHLGVKTIIGITSHPDSQLRGLSDIILDMGVVEEPCPLGLTPTASIIVMLAISDAIALTLMELKGVTRRDFGLRHHGGYLGRKARIDNLPHISEVDE